MFPMLRPQLEASSATRVFGTPSKYDASGSFQVTNLWLASIVESDRKSSERNLTALTKPVLGKAHYEVRPWGFCSLWLGSA